MVLFCYWTKTNDFHSNLRPLFITLYLHQIFKAAVSQHEFIEAKSNTLTAIKLLTLHPSTAWIDQILPLTNETITVILYFPGHNHRVNVWLIIMAPLAPAGRCYYYIIWQKNRSFSIDIAIQKDLDILLLIHLFKLFKK